VTIAGTIPALVTPFRDGGRTLDLDSMDAHVSWLAEQGVTCVSPLGTTGEGASLSLDERKSVIARLLEHPSRTAVLPGTGTNALPETIELSRFALDRGAVGVLVIPPWYFPASTTGTVRYFAELIAALPQPRVFAYHIPAFSRVPVPDEVLRLPGVTGVKDSAGDLAHTRSWLREFDSLTVLSGNDTHAAAMYADGAPGTLTMLANVFPDRLEAIRRGEDVEENQRFLVGARDVVDSVPRHAALKYLVHRRVGVARSAVRAPLDELAPNDERVLDALL
jgi:4-hydroxy-tetrahydrodipicolinate synthase